MAEYYNPQQEPGTDKRLLLVLFVSFLGITLLQFFTKSPQPPPKPGPEQQQTQPSQPSPSPGTSAATQTPSPAPTPKKGQTKGQTKGPPTKQASGATETTVENEVYRITFSNQGGLVKSWILKKYKDDFGKPLDIVNPVTAPVVGYPLSFFTYDKELQKKLNEALYVPSAIGPQPESQCDWPAGALPDAATRG